MARPARRRHALLLATVGAALLLAACGTSAPPPTDPFPPRPISIDVSRLDPCAALPAAEAGRLGLGSGSPYLATVDGTRSPSCSWLGHDGKTSYGAQVIGLDAASAAQEPGSRIITIDGFGAVRGAPATNNGPRLPAFCQVAVDVADGQALRFQLSTGDPDTGGNPAMMERTCREIERFAGQYLTALRS